MHIIFSVFWYVFILPVVLVFLALLLSLILNINFFRSLIALILPPIAVIDRGVETVLIVLVLWILGWLPGTIAALYLLKKPMTGKSIDR
ncbi:MAG: YqaE/Pmp3 family membrane protein [Solitalea-like symbiont of Acarus siro]